MKDRKTLKKALIMNIIIALIEVFSVGWMMSGIAGGILSSGGLRALRYFTVDSNILLGIVAALAAIGQYKALKEGKEPSSRIYALKLAGTVSVTITMLVTVFFLEPTMGRVFGWFVLFANSNLFLHLIDPLLAIYCWLAYEKNRQLQMRHVFLGIFPVFIYSIYYVIEVIRHTVDGVIAPGYDWYGFFAFGPRSAYIVVPLFLLFSFFVSYVLWKINRKQKKSL